MPESSPRETFRHFANHASHLLGTPGAFGIAVFLVVAWLVSGPAFHYSEAWQLTINTGTTIITFLMVFIIQHTQNRDTQAVHSKLDELIRAVERARNELVDLEDLSDEELTRLQQQFAAVRQRAVTGETPRDDDRGAT